MGHTHRGCLVSKEVDGLKSLIIEHIEAVALVPALWEDIKADHATCQQKGGHWVTLVVRAGPPTLGWAGGWERAGYLWGADRHQLCLAVPLQHVARIVADAVPMTRG